VRLLARGQLELDAMFPGFVAEMRAAGALMFDAGAGLAMRRRPGWQAIGANGFQTLWSSRDLLEHTLRSLLRRQTKIQLREGVHVTALCGSHGRAPAVTGVRLRADGGEEELRADLVVDASGRNTHAEQWLRALSVPAIETMRVDAHCGYASRFYKAPSGAQRPKDWWWQGLWVEWEPPDLPRAGVIFPIEGDRWLVTLAGIAPDLPPTDEQGYEQFAARLSSQSLTRALAHAEPISPISGNRAMANVFRRYDQLANPPRGFVAVGDGVCAFNPIYGQGMSSAAACASILRDVLRKRGKKPGFERAFFAAQAAFLTSVWNLATGADFAWPTTEGERPRLPKVVAEYFNLAMRAAHDDAELRSHIAPVFNLVASINLFFDPRFAAKVLLHTGKERLREHVLGAPLIPDAPPPPA
jgi:2-polyprenyl-6-methoxyphenol hydroxylase-like FAD-dependent oxidoreductase